MVSRGKISSSTASKLIVLLSVFLLLLQTVDYLNFTVDDVFIPIRYAMNAAHGNGLVYNTGEFVEGYSDPLWVLALSGIARFIAKPAMSVTLLLWSAKAISYLFGLLTLFTLYRFTERIFEHSERRSLFAACALLAASMCAPFIAWSVGGLETTLIAFLYLLLAVIVFDILKVQMEGRKIPAKLYIYLMIILLAATLTRPEPVMLSFIVFIFLLFQFPGQERARLIGMAIGPYVVGLCLFLAWRWTNYHALLPNTFYAKTGGGISGYINGIKYVFASIGILIAPLLVFFPFAYRSERKKDRFLLFVTIAVGFECFFAIFARGDWMPGARFLIPVEPLLVVIGILGLARLVEKLEGKGAWNPSAEVLVASALFVSITFAMAGRTAFRGEARELISGFSSLKGHSLSGHEQIGAWLESHVGANSSVALSEAGLIGTMIPNTHILDLNGLMDTQIAKSRHSGIPMNVQYVLDHKPDFIVLYHDQVSPILSSLATDPHDALEGSSIFHSQYKMVQEFPQFEIYARNP